MSGGISREWFHPTQSDGEDQEKQWFAAYTMSKHEKRVSEHCGVAGIEYFLPVYGSKRTWKNRITTVIQLPLFPNYIFVRLGQRDYSRLLRLPGILSTIGSGAGPVAIPDREIEDLRRIVLRPSVEPHPQLKAGDSVRILFGPLAGLVGTVQRRSNGIRFVVALDCIQRSISVEIEECELEPFARNSGNGRRERESYVA